MQIFLRIYRSYEIKPRISGQEILRYKLPLPRFTVSLRICSRLRMLCPGNGEI